MKKSSKIAIMVIILLAIIAITIVVIMMNRKDDTTPVETTKSKLGEINSAEDLEKLIDKIYEGNNELPKLQTQTIDVNEERLVNAYTGLENGKDLEYLVVSEPLMSSQAYSLVLAKVKNGVDANKIAKEMSEKIDMRKWVCVSAEKLYATNSDDIVFLVMSNEETTSTIYNKFKDLAGFVGEKQEKSEEIVDFPEDMY